jgi:dTDP-glucose 4,6-dehydratase
MQTILVTGGAGFIGSCFVRQWLAEESGRLVNLDKLTYAGNLASLADVADHANYVFVPGDIADAALVARLLDQYRPNAVVNLAAESHVDRSIDGPAPFVQTNVVGTFTMLEACRQYWTGLGVKDRERFRFLQVSTDEVYGSLGPDDERFTEASRYSPNSPYAASKAAADHFVRAYFRTHGLPVLTVHGSNTYGPRQFPEKLIPLTILNALEGRPIPVYGDGRQVRDWLHVEDHCRAIRRVLDAGSPGEEYGVGADGERTNLEVIRTLCRMVDRLRPELPHAPCESLIQFVTDRPGHDRRYATDAGRIRRELGWTPCVGFESGLEQTVQWYLDHGDWVRRVTSGGDHRERLGLGDKTTR